MPVVIVSEPTEKCSKKFQIRNKIVRNSTSNFMAFSTLMDLRLEKALGREILSERF